jgi:predicted ester cyclase
MAELLTDKIKINSLTFGSYNGIKEASKYWDELFEAFPDIKINPVTITTDNRKNRVLTEMDISGTQKGKVGSTLGFGKKFRIRGVFVYDFMGYKIKEIWMHYDSSILKRQLNILKT